MDPIEPEGASATFWDRLYRSGGTSGTGSVGRLAKFKAEIVNGLVTEHRIRSVVELGCGEGSQLALMAYPRYVGLDTSPAAVERCEQRFAGDPTKRFAVYRPFSRSEPLPGGDLAVSLDVVYHLLEDDVYERYMSDLFAMAHRFVLVYSSDRDEPSCWDEVRHHRFTDWVDHRQPHWRLLAKIPQCFPYVDGDPETSWSDFFLYQRVDAVPRAGWQAWVRNLVIGSAGRRAGRHWRGRYGSRERPPTKRGPRGC